MRTAVPGGLEAGLWQRPAGGRREAPRRLRSSSGSGEGSPAAGARPSLLSRVAGLPLSSHTCAHTHTFTQSLNTPHTLIHTLSTAHTYIDTLNTAHTHSHTQHTSHTHSTHLIHSFTQHSSHTHIHTLNTPYTRTQHTSHTHSHTLIHTTHPSPHTHTRCAGAGPGIWSRFCVPRAGSGAAAFPPGGGRGGDVRCPVCTRTAALPSNTERPFDGRAIVSSHEFPAS